MSKEINYGKYVNLPPTLVRLAELDKKLKKEGYSLDMDISLCLHEERYAYDVTPYDVITFASIGADGIHFGLLTDFGTVTDLEEAFIVCVSPMDHGDHIKIVARNLSEFVRLVCTVGDAAAIANFLLFEEENEYRDYLEELEQEREEDEYAESAFFVINQLKTILDGPLIEDVYQYVEREVKKRREDQIILSTLDGLGIVPFNHKSNNHDLYKLEKDMTINLADVRTFLNKASRESKLAFIRDVHFTFLMDDKEHRDIIIDEMYGLGLSDELNRLKYPY